MVLLRLVSAIIAFVAVASLASVSPASVSPASVSPASDQESSAIDVGTRAARLSQRVMSPFCPGKTLYDCPSSSATNMRLTMASWMEDGLGEEAVVQRLQDEMPGFDFTPPVATSGLFWGVWVLATLVLLLATLRMVRRKRTGLEENDGSGEAGLEGEDDEYDERLDDALRRVSR